MKSRPLFLLYSLALAASVTAAEDGFKSLFNGKDLTGWNGNPRFWSVRDGALTGETTADNPTRGNTFIIWTGGTTGDFELRFSYRIVNGNSGVQYRSKVVNPDRWVVGGYQADFEAGTRYSGILYDEAGVAGERGIMAERGEKVVWGADCKKQVTGSVGKSDDIQAAIKKEDWNDYVITARGHHLVHKINGHVTVDVTDDCESKRLKSGVLALQLHAGPPMLVQFKDIRLKSFTDGPSAKSDLDLLQGEWELTELVIDGTARSPDEAAALKVRITGNEYRIESADHPGRGRFVLRDERSPRAMDVTAEDGTEMPAIYEVDANQFKACYAVNGAPRPAVFKSTEGSDHILAVYRRK